MKNGPIFDIALPAAKTILRCFGYQVSQGVGEQVPESSVTRFTESTAWYLVRDAAASPGEPSVLMLMRVRSMERASAESGSSSASTPGCFGTTCFLPAPAQPSSPAGRRESTLR